MIVVIFYILFVVSSELLISEEFINIHGDNSINDDNPELLTRGILPTQEYAKLNINNEQDIFVNLISGNLIYKRLDYYLFDIGFPVILEFTYNSGSTFAGRYGNNWQFSYNLRFVENNFNKNIILIENDDKSIIFNYSDSTFISHNTRYKLERNENSIIIENFGNTFFKDTDYVRYTFSPFFHNYVNSIEDRNKNKVNFIYNSDKQLVSIKFKSGRSVNLFYQDNLLSRISIPNYGDIKYFYSNRNLIKVVYPNLKEVAYHYDSECNFLSKIINNRDTFDIEYTNNFLVSKFYKHKSDFEYTIDYDLVNKKNYLKDKFGKTILIEFDSLFRTNSVYKYGSIHKKQTWDTLNQLIEYINPLNKVFSYNYNELGLIKEYSGEDMKINYAHENKFGRLLQIQINNSMIDFILDNNSNIINIKKNQEITTNINYDINGQLLSLSDNKDDFDFLYDGLGNFKRIIINKDLEFSFSYNNNNDLTNIAEFDFFNISANYDYSNNEIIVANDYDKIFKNIYFNTSGNIDSINIKDIQFERYYYDFSNRLISYKIDELFSFDLKYAGDTLINIVYPNGIKTIKYDFRNNLKTILKPDKYDYKYDFQNRLIQESINGNSLFEYQYDSESNLKKIIYPNSSSLEIFYDDFRRIIKLTDQNKTNKIYSWDNFDRLIKYQEKDMVYNFIHNDNSYSTILPSGKTFNVLENHRSEELNYKSYLFKVNYDRYGRVSDILKNNNEIIRYSYSDNSIKTIINNGEDTYNFKYNSLHKLIEVVHNNEIIKSIIYDNHSRISNFKDKNLEYILAYDSFNRLIFLKNNDNITKFNYNNGEFTININDKDYYFNFFNNNLTSASNPNLDKIIINYEDIIYPSKIVAPESVSLDLEFNNNRLNAIMNLNNDKTIFNYNDYGKLTSIINKNSFSRSFIYNSDFNIIEYNDFNKNIYSIFYNDYFGKSKIVDENGDSIKFSYDENLFLNSFKDFVGRTIYFENDKKGNITKLFDEFDTINYNYNISNKIIGTNYNNKYFVKYNYDKFNNLENIILNDTLSFKILYDNYKQINKILLDNEQILNIGRDNLGNINYEEYWQKIPITYKIGDYGQILESHGISKRKYNYDKLGRLIQISVNNDAKESFNYNNNSRLINKIDFYNNTFTYDYDKNNNVILMTRNVLDSIRFYYNENGELLSSFLNDNESFNIEFSKGSISSIKNDKYFINLKYLDNYRIILNGNYFVDTLKFDKHLRLISYHNNDYKYNNYGLKKIIGTNSINYDNLLRKIDDGNLNITNIEYSNKLYPNSIYFENKTFQVDYQFFSTISLMVFGRDTFKIDRNIDNNIINLSKNEIKVIEAISDEYDNISYHFNKINQINIFKNNITQYGFEKNPLSLDYYYNGNLRTINQNNSKLLSYNYDNLGNPILGDDAAGNSVQYSYKNDLINEIDYSNGKFIRYQYDVSDNLILAFSNSELADSIRIKQTEKDSTNISIKYFDDNFQIFEDNNNFKLFLNGKIFDIFSITKDSDKLNLIINDIEHEIKGDSIISEKFTLVTEKNYEKTIQKLSNSNVTHTLIDEINIYKLLTNSTINGDTLISNKYDELNRLSQSKIKDNFVFEYDEFNKLKSIQSETDTTIIKHNISSISINNDTLILNPNKSVSNIINNQDTIKLFYDFADRLSDHINNDHKVKLLYNSIGELSAIIDKDTTIIINFLSDSLDCTLLINNQKNQNDLYIFQKYNYLFPIIKYDLTNNNLEYLFRNTSGHPFLMIDSSSNFININDMNIYGARDSSIKDFIYFYKDYFFVENLNLFYNDGQIIDTKNGIPYNKYLKNQIDGLSYINFRNPFLISDSADDLSQEFLLDLNDIYKTIDPFENKFTDIINKNKKELIIDEINSIFNNFKPFNLNPILKQDIELGIFERANIKNYLPNINDYAKLNIPELVFAPILPRILSDSIIIKNIKINKIKDPKLKFERKSKFKQIVEFLKLVELDTNFILYSKIAKLQNILDKPKISYPLNVIDLKLFVIENNDLNKLSNPNELLIKLLENQTNDTEDIINNIYNKLKIPIENDDTEVILNKPTHKFNDILIKKDLINSFLPIPLETLNNVSIENINRVLKLSFLPFPFHYLPSNHLYENNLIKINFRKSKNPINKQFIIQKSFNHIK